MVGGVGAILLMFAFERQFDSVLELAGYDRNVVSYISFVRNIHSRFVLYYRESANLDIAYFHMLDVVVLLSVVAWGCWLTAAIIFLRRCDDEIRSFCQRVFERFRGRLLFLCFAWAAGLSSPIILTICPRKPLTNPEMLLLLRYVPKAYFLTVALSYYWCGGFLFSLSILLLIWKMTR
jgi:hypothetical protein